MGRCKDGDGIKSSLIISEVQKRPCLYDMNNMNYGDRAEKAKCWDEVYEIVVPAWSALGQAEKLAHGKEVQKRWRSIRDSYTKAYRQGKCVPQQCAPGSRRSQYHKQMAFLLRALQSKKQRSSQDKYESFSEVSNSPQHPAPEDVTPKIKYELTDKPLDLKTINCQPVKPENTTNYTKSTQTHEKPKEMQKSLDSKLDPNNILPEDYFDDDRLFMNSLLPLFKKMNDDTRLLCRIEVLKIIRYALQGHTSFESLNLTEDSFFQSRVSAVIDKVNGSVTKPIETKLSMTTRSADGSRPVRKRRHRSPSPLPVPQKRRGPGRPRKIKPPPSDSEEETRPRRATPKLRVCPLNTGKLPYDAKMTEMEKTISLATRVDQLDTPTFMKMYNLERSKEALIAASPKSSITIKTEPLD